MLFYGENFMIHFLTFNTQLIRKFSHNYKEGIFGQKLLTRRKTHKNQMRVAFDSTP
jgi:hypothetical protein